MLDRLEALRLQLRRYQTPDPEEIRAAAQLRDLLAAPGDPFTRARYDPGHVTASAFVVCPDRAALLMILHGKLNRWLQPGGHIEPDDPTIQAAAAREVSEETGLALDAEGGELFDVDVHPIPARKHEPAHHHFDVRYLFNACSRRLAVGSDAVAVQWVPFNQVAALTPDRSVLRALEKVMPRGG